MKRPKVGDANISLFFVFGFDLVIGAGSAPATHVAAYAARFAGLSLPGEGDEGGFAGTDVLIARTQLALAVMMHEGAHGLRARREQASDTI